MSYQSKWSHISIIKSNIRIILKTHEQQIEYAIIIMCPICIARSNERIVINSYMSVSSQECEDLQQFQIEEEDKHYNFNSPGKASANTNTSESHISFVQAKKLCQEQMHHINEQLQSHIQQDVLASQESLVHWQRGDEFLEGGELEQAIIQYKKCIQIKPFLTKAEFVGLGSVQDRIGYHYESEYSWIQKMKRETKRSISPHDLLSVCMSKSSLYHQHKDWYLKMIQDTNDFRLIYGLANLEYNHKRFMQAESLYRECLQLSPHFDQVYQKIANIYCFKLNKDDQATIWAQKSLQLNPSNIYASLIKALCIKTVDERIEALKGILVDDYARPFNGLGNAYYNNCNYDDAIKMYKKSIEINSKYEHPYYGLGSIYNQISNFDQSIKWYKKCIEVNPLYDYPLYGLGIAYNNKNDTKNAILWLQKCIQVNPKYDCPYYALGNIYRTSKRYELALKYYKKSLECKKIDPLCFVNIALSYMSMFDYENAYEYMLMAEQNLNDVDGLSKGNIEYVKQQIAKYLNEDKCLQKNQKGLLSFKQILEISKNSCKFKAQFQQLFRNKVNDHS